jgi:hypothetical protein
MVVRDLSQTGTFSQTMKEYGLTHQVNRFWKMQVPFKLKPASNREEM